MAASKTNDILRNRCCYLSNFYPMTSFLCLTVLFKNVLFLKQKRFFSIFDLGYKSMLIPTKNNMKIRTLSKNKINGKLHLNTKQVHIWINWKIVIIQYFFPPPTAPPPLHMWKPIIIPLVKTSLQTLILIINLFHPIEQKLISLK
jgi:hypothetical protein